MLDSPCILKTRVYVRLVDVIMIVLLLMNAKKLKTVAQLRIFVNVDEWYELKKLHGLCLQML